MLLKNLDIAKGLCNGTRLIAVRFGRHIIECTFATGARQGQHVLIPRINNYCDRNYPFRLRRRRFPIRLAFAMTINKAQGQTLTRVEFFLPDDVFSHGQLYVALSRVRNSASIKIQAPSNVIANIVFPNVLWTSTSEGTLQALHRRYASPFPKFTVSSCLFRRIHLSLFHHTANPDSSCTLHSSNLHVDARAAGVLAPPCFR